MRFTTLAILLTSTLAFAQSAKTLPGGAVMKPGQPPPVVPLHPVQPANPQLDKLKDLIGSFTATTKSGAQLSAHCDYAAGQRWIACDVTSAAPGWSALVVVGWDKPEHAYRVLVADNRPSSTTAKATLTAASKLTLRGGTFGKITADLADPAKITVSTPSEVVTLLRAR